MVRDIIVLRSIPDWLGNDMTLKTREFCRRLGWPEDTIIGFQEMWDSLFRISHREFRTEVKSISIDSFRNCHGAELATSFCSYSDLRTRLYFTDDDDWFHPRMIEVVRDSISGESDGALWGSIFFGHRFWGEGNAKSTSVRKRAIDNTVYKNNSVVTVRLLQQNSRLRTLEHNETQQLFDNSSICVTQIPKYLSCTNKHPGIATFLMESLKLPSNADAFHDLFNAYNAAIMTKSFDSETEWIEPFAARIADLCWRTLSSARRQGA